MRRNKRGQTTTPLVFMLAFVVLFSVAGIIMSFTTQINSDVAADFDNGTDEKKVAANVTDGQLNVAKKQGSIGNIGAAVVVITLLIGGLGAVALGRR